MFDKLITSLAVVILSGAVLVNHASAQIAISSGAANVGVGAGGGGGTGMYPAGGGPGVSGGPRHSGGGLAALLFEPVPTSRHLAKVRKRTR
jgi:hypothetical protein